MIEPTDSVFPNNIVTMVALRAGLIDSDLHVYKRPLRNTDPNQTVGILAATWVPDEESREMLGQPFANQVPLSRYHVLLQAFIRDADEERGLNVHSVLSRKLRAMLYTDQPLRVALSTLSSTVDGSRESTKRWSISNQRFFTNEIQGEWLYLSTLEFWLETETR